VLFLQVGPGSNQGLEFARVVEFLLRAISAGIVSGGVVAEPIAQGFNETGAIFVTRTLERFVDDLKHRDRIIAIDTKPIDTRGQGLVGDGWRGGLFFQRHRNCPAIIVDHEYHR